MSDSTARNYNDENSKHRNQFMTSTISAPSAPADPEIFDATHFMSSSNKSRGNVSLNVLYFSKVYHQGLYRGRTFVYGCFTWRTSKTV